MSGKHGPIATLDQIEQALRALTDADFRSLRKFASQHLWKTSIDNPDELINETIRRLADGDRKWPTNIPFDFFLKNAMRSVADGIRGLKHQTDEGLAADDCGDEAGDPMDAFASEALTPEETLLKEEARRKASESLEIIYGHFEGDPQATCILMGIEDGLKAEEVREIGDMSLTQYETARKRLRRGIERLFPERREK